MSQDVLDYLQLHNRPFSANDIIINVSKNKELTKPQIQKALDKLVKQGAVFDKVYNKQKLYCIKQEDVGDPQAFEEELKELDRNIMTTQSKFKETQENIMISSTKCKEMQSRMTMTEAKESQSKMNAEVSELVKAVNELSENREEIADTDRKKVYEEHGRVLKEYRKRKRICIDILEAILEGYPKSKKQLYEDIGIELDEDNDFNLKHPI